MAMDGEPLTPAFVQEYLRRVVGIEISLEEVAAIIPRIEANRDQLAALDRFDLREVRPASVFDPT
jgi:hypothetical protein